MDCDAVVTDPPYGISILGKKGCIGGTSKNISRWKGQINTVYVPMIGDNTIIDITPLFQCGKTRVIWGGNYFANQLPPSKAWLVWYKRIKGQVNSFSDCELAWTDAQCPARVFQYLWMGMIRDGEQEEHYHPTQKPVSLIMWSMETIKIPAGTIILDPFMGSGTTGIACIRTGRQFIGIEMNEVYFEIAKKRIQNELRQQRLNV